MCIRDRYINGVFTGEIGSISNFAINLTFFILIGILMIISAVFFNRLNRAGDALERVAKSMSTQYELSSANLWSQYKEKENVFEDSVLDTQFAKYQRRIKAHTTKKGTVTSADVYKRQGQQYGTVYSWILSIFIRIFYHQYNQL